MIDKNEVLLRELARSTCKGMVASGNKFVDVTIITQSYKETVINNKRDIVFFSNLFLSAMVFLHDNDYIDTLTTKDIFMVKVSEFGKEWMTSNLPLPID